MSVQQSPEGESSTGLTLHGYLGVVREIDQKYQKFLSRDEKAVVSKLRSFLLELSKVVLPDSETQLKLFFSNYPSENSSSQCRPMMGGMASILKELDRNVEFVQSLTDKLEERFHHNLMRFFSPQYILDKAYGNGIISNRSKSKRRLRKNKNKSSSPPTSACSDSSMSSSGSLEEIKNSSMDNTSDLDRAHHEVEVEGETNEPEWDEKYRDEISNDCLNDKSVQTEYWNECLGEDNDDDDDSDILLVEISENEWSEHDEKY